VNCYVVCCGMWLCVVGGMVCVVWHILWRVTCSDVVCGVLFDVAWCGMCRGVVMYSVWYGMVCDVVWCGVVWYCVVKYVVWCGVVCGML
jgi:hypothetical protein